MAAKMVALQQRFVAVLADASAETEDQALAAAERPYNLPVEREEATCANPPRAF